MKAWLIGAGVALLTLAVAALAHLRSFTGKLELLPATYDLFDQDGDGNTDLTATRFKFANRPWHKLFAPISLRYAPMWKFTVLTNDGAGSFVEGFEPRVLHRNRHDSLEDYFEFMVHDMPPLKADWKMRVTRTVEYRLTSPFSSITRSVKMPQEVWESDVLRPPIRFPDRPPPTNQQPAFLTNGGSIFGEPELHYTP
jgi:hypothetical protein